VDFPVEILKNSSLFANIKKQEISSMLTCLNAEKKTFNKNDFIFSAGDTVSKVGIVVSGSVQIIKEDFYGNRSIFDKIEKADIFGESYSYTLNAKLPLDIVASEKTEIIFIDYKKIISTCSSACLFHSRLIQNILTILATKNIKINEKMHHLTQRTIREKLFSYLSLQSIKNEKKEFDIPFNRQELADYLSIDRSALSKELCKMRDEGIITFNKNHFKLKTADKQ